MLLMKTVMIILMTILFSLLFISQSSHAEFYKWVDEKGTVHFTEDPATIPEKYKDKAKGRLTEEDLMTPEQRVRERARHEKEAEERMRQQKIKYENETVEKKARKDAQDQKKAAQDRQKAIQELIDSGRCEIVAYSQFDRATGGGTVSGGSVSGGRMIPGSGGVVSGGSVSGGVITGNTETCVDVTIQNNTPETKTIQNNNLVATTRKGNKVSPKQGLMIRLAPGDTYRGDVCFGRDLSAIVTLELKGI
jgi:hypothetical protein